MNFLIIYYDDGSRRYINIDTIREFSATNRQVNYITTADGNEYDFEGVEKWELI